MIYRIIVVVMHFIRLEHTGLKMYLMKKVSSLDY